MAGDTVAFCGLGAMGINMAANLANSLERQGRKPLIVWNRSKEKTSQVASKHIIPADSLVAVASEANIIVSCLGNDAAVVAVWNELAPNLKPGTLVIEQSTVDPSIHANIEKAVTERKANFVAGNIFGPVPLAKSAQLILCVAGEEQYRKQAEQLLVPAIAKSVIHVGDEATLGSKLKLIGNGVIIGVMELIAESMTLADKTGVGAENVRKYFEAFFNTPSFLGYSEKMLTNHFIPAGFNIAGGLKDVGHIRELAASVDCPVPVMDIAHGHMVTARSMGKPELDWSSLVIGQRVAAGLRPDGRTDKLDPLKQNFGE